MRTHTKLAIAALLTLATSALADATDVELAIGAVPEAPAAELIVEAEVRRYLFASFSLQLVPQVADAQEVIAAEVQTEVAAAFHPSHFGDPNEAETEMLVAYSLATMNAESTGSISASVQAVAAEAGNSEDDLHMLP